MIELELEEEGCNVLLGTTQVELELEDIIPVGEVVRTLGTMDVVIADEVASTRIETTILASMFCTLLRYDLYARPKLVSSCVTHTGK